MLARKLETYIMTSRIWLWAALLAGLIWHFLPAHHTPFAMPVAANARSGNAIEPQDFMPLFDAETPLSSLAGDGVYTVVEVYINTCSVCKQIEHELPPFLAARNDVVVKRVHYPESGLSWPLSEAVSMEKRMNGYRICGTPHIEIYGPDGHALAQDDCGNKDALNFLRAWMAAEQSRT
jgi:hypothetical protein